MFGLFSGCFEALLRKEELHVLLIGLDKAGKTTLLERLKTLYTDLPGLEADKVLPTVGLNLAHFQALGIPLLCWDVGGAAGLRGIWSKYYGECHAVVFVVDGADRGRFEEAKAALDRALADPDLYGAPLLVLANKHDVVGAASPADMAEVFGLVQLSEMRPCSMQAVTARTGEGVKAAVQWLVENIKKSQRSELIRRRMLAQ
ncbi:hypothetical protein D9Q98_003165 [Chlorella vulgaris]|uniref:ADP-ribosylation factor-related protein 1 n=1 Tax=Chlorella vulgaris TaxID=3077 RepID=A0A9D4TS85_CHLVU|nr:hypothetical protein D9Q98_003165 [Chlorella vulgaris]